MNLFGNQHLKQVRQLTRLGDLQTACAIARESGCLQGASGVRTANSLVDKLVVRAERQECAGNLVAAWQDLNDAVSVQTDDRIDVLARHQSRLIDSTIQHAESCLQRGQVTNAHRLVDILARRKILDRRADEIISVCSLVNNAQVLAASGKWNESSRMLQQAHQLRPDMEFVESRLRANQRDEQSVQKMTSQLRDALNQSNWGNVQTITGQILQVSPNHQIAIDARRRCQSHYVKQPAATSREVTIINEPGQFEKSDTVHTISDNETTRSSTSARRTLATQVAEPIALPCEPDQCNVRSFMLWVDGVGGYLVCTWPQVTIGRAVERSEVDIPVHADIRRRHLHIKRSANGYIAEPLEANGPNDSAVTKPMILGHGQKIDIGGGVQARFSMPHPLGCSARIDFISRHRTDPWSDAVLLLGDALMIGPFDSHHVRSPRLNEELLLFRNGNEIILRAPGSYELDGETKSGDITVNRNLRLVGKGYSVSLEMIKHANPT